MQVPTSFEIEQHEPGAELVSGNTETDRQFIETVRGAHTFNDSGDVNQVPERPFQASKTRDLPIEDVLVKQLLASGEADALLNGYRDMARSFPFVPLHPNTSSQDLHAKKPMLFLAMITAASWKEHQQQIALDTIYRKELANRTIVTPRKTLGLVQSVLVYLSWQVILTVAEVTGLMRLGIILCSVIKRSKSFFYTILSSAWLSTSDCIRIISLYALLIVRNFHHLVLKTSENDNGHFLVAITWHLCKNFPVWKGNMSNLTQDGCGVSKVESPEIHACYDRMGSEPKT